MLGESEIVTLRINDGTSTHPKMDVSVREWQQACMAAGNQGSYADLVGLNGGSGSRGEPLPIGTGFLRIFGSPRDVPHLPNVREWDAAIVERGVEAPMKGDIRVFGPVVPAASSN